MSGDQQLGAIQGQVSSLFATNIPPQITEADLFAVYSSEDSPNRIQALRIVRDANNHAKYAYLNFASPEDALEILNTKNYSVFDGHEITLAKNIKPQSLNPEANLYISGFAGPVSNKDLHDALSVFGPIASASTRTVTIPNGAERVFAYVQFETLEAANAAISSIRQGGLRLPNNRVETVSIEAFKSRTARQNEFTNVFVRNFPINFSREQFQALAERYGTVTSVYLPPSFAPKPGTTEPSRTGFGFANYASPEDARKAIAGLSEEVVGEFKLQAFKAKDRVARDREVAAQTAHYSSTHKDRGFRHQQNSRSSVISLKNLPPELTLVEVTKMLSQYGQISNITRHLYHNSYRCQFSKPEMASAAYAALSGQYAVTFTFPSRPHQNRFRRHHREHRNPYPRHHYHPSAFGYPPYGYPPNFQYMQPGIHQQAHPHHHQMHPQQPPRGSTRRQRQMQPQQMHPHQQPPQQIKPTGPLSEQERQDLGSALYYKIQHINNGNDDSTSKITGMLLELPPNDIRDLVTNDEALQQKIHEALQVLGQTA